MAKTRKTYRQLREEAGPYDSYRLVTIQIENGIAIVEMRDPETLNAFSVRMCGELRRCFAQLELDDDVAAIVLTGTGGAFSAGGDLRQMKAGHTEPIETYEFIRSEFGGVALAIVKLGKPVIAAVNGAAMGVGFFTALACDMIIAAEDAVFGTAYIHLGLMPLGVSYILARSVGYHRAFELCALAPNISAAEGQALGFVNRVVAHDELRDRSAELAATLATRSPRAMRFCKEVLRKSVQSDLEDHLLLGEAIQPLLLETEEHREALEAFLRRPKTDRERS